MSLSNFQKNIDRAVERQGSVFIEDDGTYYDVGQVKNVELSWEPVVTEPDTAGRTKQLAADVTLTFVMQQTSDQELSALDALTGVGSGNGLTIKVTDAPATSATASGADGFTFVNCLPVITGQISFTAEESTMTVEVSGRVPMSELIKLGTSDTLTFDA